MAQGGAWRCPSCCWWCPDLLSLLLLKKSGCHDCDEEHEAAYKQDSNPVTMVAILRARYNQQLWFWICYNAELRETGHVLAKASINTYV